MKAVAIVVMLLAAFALSGCTSMKVVAVDPGTGYFPSQKKAVVVSSKPIDLDRRNALIVIENSDFMAGQLKNLHYFGEVITVGELEKRIIAAGLSDKVPSVSNLIGLSNAAKYYKDFLVLRTDSRGTPRVFSQFVLTDPLTAEDVFVTETELDYLWAGVNDQNNWYPMFNSLIDYIKRNSKTYDRP